VPKSALNRKKLDGADADWRVFYGLGRFLFSLPRIQWKTTLAREWKPGNGIGAQRKLGNKTAHGVRSCGNEDTHRRPKRTG
jgi:hypothetical protein